MASLGDTALPDPGFPVKELGKGWPGWDRSERPSTSGCFFAREAEQVGWQASLPTYLTRVGGWDREDQTE